MGLLAENERLRGRLDVYQSKAAVLSAAVPRPSALGPAPRVPVPVVAAAAVPVAVPAATPKPVETWSVVVRGKQGATSKEVINKVVEQVGPTLGVRVHELKPLRNGGAVIRTPSVVERQKVVANTKFGEVGLEVTVGDKLGPRVVVRGVHSEISSDEFMSELFEMNLKEKMSAEAFKKSVRLVTGPWKGKTGGQINVVLEGSEKAMEFLLNVGRVYIKWFSFVVRSQETVPVCYRCLGFDHRVRDCRMKEDVCRICGLGGHLSSHCQNMPHCRNCAFRGLPAEHLMLSSACPTYAAMVARANARH